MVLGVDMALSFRIAMIVFLTVMIDWELLRSDAEKTSDSSCSLYTFEQLQLLYQNATSYFLAVAEQSFEISAFVKTDDVLPVQ